MTKVRLPLACLAACALALTVAACGSSSPASPASTNVAAAGGAGGYGGGPGGVRGRPNSQRRAQITACLRKQGVTLPQRPGGAGGPGAQSGGGPGRFADPAVRAALAKCGITPGGLGGSGASANNPASRARLTAFVACMRTDGVNLPAPNTSGSGPVFGGVNRSDPKFAAAFAKCRATLGSAFGQGGQAGGG